jgi:SAM-dependent methyltransferase
MTFSPEWNQLYLDSAHMSIWPWSDVVSYVHRYAKPAAGFQRVLELGCGAGANIPFFLKLDVDYSAIEGSSAIVVRLHQTYPIIQDKILVGDFTQSIPFEEPFDLIVDRGSLIHNDTAGIRSGLALAYQHLRPGGKFIGIDWFSDAHSSVSLGQAFDSHTRTDILTGHLAGTGKVHFCDQAHLLGLLSEAGFQGQRLEHKQNDVLIPTGGECFAWWNFVAVKP